ncbi:RNA-directed DNA polymerase [Ginsengibacter hankyongi]|uniref:RNA-directed DNA polymerase n=1 Tax=Ginsengibacter hankyongi TaxID=2607284 RepID=A0A5J5IJZ7_9BACT|nr:reverse transcriptase family protein [Ginsengibacter hankyongi]KAA9039512.1 RNA-directed DNA polymerase [Ginsengibacter hankyongi]
MIRSLYQLYSELGVNKRLLIEITTNPQKLYYKKIRPKRKFGTYQEGENGSIRLRHLMPPVHSLKIIQGKIRDHLQRIELPDCMYGSVQGKNNIINALQHVDNIFFLKIDLKKYFTNISNKQVHRVLLENKFSWEVARIITKLTTYQCSLPQGAPSSPAIANLTFSATARNLQEFVKGRGITFTIFLDDIVFSSKKDFKNLVPGILNMIRKNGFFPHNKKINYRKYNCDVTGLVVGSGKLKIVPKMKQAALTNARVRGYINFVNRYYQAYLLKKSTASF